MILEPGSWTSLVAHKLGELKNDVDIFRGESFVAGSFGIGSCWAGELLVTVGW